MGEIYTHARRYLARKRMLAGEIELNGLDSRKTKVNEMAITLKVAATMFHVRALRKKSKLL